MINAIDVCQSIILISYTILSEIWNGSRAATYAKIVMYANVKIGQR